MIINKAWRILTVGDGDLSFSHSLAKYHCPANLTASIYDSREVMLAKYSDNAYQALVERRVEVLFNFDITDQNSWSSLTKQSFDVVIFQFPLMPAFQNVDEYKKQGGGIGIHLLNRLLLRDFLKHSSQYFLDPNGEQLCYITSKDVKPYREWNIENTLHQQSNIHYLGSSLFNITDFPEYQVRNVDRDKHVRDTQGRTYVWSVQKNNSIKDSLSAAIFQDEDCCTTCRAGPFTTNFDREVHNASKKHQQRQVIEAMWQEKISPFCII